MKKIVCAAAVVAMAIGVQAATIKWGTSGGVYSDSTGAATTTVDGGKVVLVMMSSATGWDSATYLADATLSTRTASLGKASGTLSFTYNPDDTTANSVNNGDYLALMFKSDADDSLSQLTYTTGDDAGAVVASTWQVSGLVNNSSSIAASSANLAFTGNFTAVPEPTSGLLMLLGMAGLALRRRRA